LAGAWYAAADDDVADADGGGADDAADAAADDADAVRNLAFLTVSPRII
jgi:hypothetical protein